MDPVLPTTTYCISLDDDPMIYKIIEGITKLKTLPFVSGKKLLERAGNYTPRVVFVDIHLNENESGLEVLPNFRQIWPNTPIIVMTSDETTDLIGQSLTLGANDFIKKPLNPDEVKARVQARIFEMEQRAARDCYVFGDLRFDKGQRSIEGPLGRRFLSMGEWLLLTYLLQMRGIIVSKSDLKGKVWGDLNVSDNAVDRKLTVVRQALKDVSNSVCIVATYGRGVSIKIIDHDNQFSKSIS